MLSPTRDELTTNIGLYIEAATGLANDKIIRGLQNAPAPLDNYCSFNYTSAAIVGTPAYTYTVNELDDKKIDIDLKSKRVYSFDVRFHRDGATDLANNFVLYTKSPLAQEFFQTSFFTIDRLQQFDLTSPVLSQNYEDQAIVRSDLLVDERKRFTTNAVEEITLDFIVCVANNVSIAGQFTVIDNG